MNEVVERLKTWNIPLVEDAVASPEVGEFFRGWLPASNPKSILITESTELDAAPSADLAAWAVYELASKGRIRSFAYHVNGISLWANETTLSPDVAGKVGSCDLLWVEELAGGTLTEHQRTALYSFLLTVTSSRKRTIVSVSTSIDQLCEWIGEVAGKILIRNFDILQT